MMCAVIGVIGLIWPELAMTQEVIATLTLKSKLPIMTKKVRFETYG
jgi:hypothetical protein